MKILFKEDSLHNENFILSREWFEGNINGCFAIQSVIGINTRRFHGLYNINTPNLEEPLSLLANLEEKLTINDFAFTFSSSQFSEEIEPKGYRYIKEFQYVTHPQYRYEIKKISFNKELLIHSKINALIIKYSFDDLPKRKKIKLILKPFFTYKKILSSKTKDPSMSGDVYQRDDILEYRPYSTDMILYMISSNNNFIASPLWYYNFYHALDFPRPSTEDYFNPGFFEIPIDQNGDYYLIFSMDPIDLETAVELFNEEKNYRYERLVSKNNKELMKKSINLVFHKYLYAYRDVFFLKNSPMDNSINVIDSLWALTGLMFYDKIPYISNKIKESWEHIKVKNFLPDKFIYQYNSRVFETPLPNMFYIIIARLLHDFSEQSYKDLINAGIIKDLFDAFLKDRFSGFTLSGSGILTFSNEKENFIWNKPFGISNLPLHVKIDEFLLNILWYNVVKAMQKIQPNSFSLFRRNDLNKLEQKICKYISNNAKNYIPQYSELIWTFILSLPEHCLPEDLVLQMEIAIEDKLTPLGIKHQLEMVNPVEIYLPIGIYFYLFHLKKTLSQEEFRQKLGFYMTYFADTMYSDTILHHPEAFLERDGKTIAIGSNLSLLNLSLAYFWFSLSLH
ncbi:MAG: hypothetical protein Kow00108_21600 [Calditrichia bacterium]